MVNRLSAIPNLPQDEQFRSELVDRYWAIDRLEEWLAAGDGRIFLITGPPGTGKTSLVTQLVLRATRGMSDGDRFPRLDASALALAHFCDASNERTLDPLEFVSSLSNGLAHVVPGFADAVAEAAAGASTTFSITGTLSAETVHPGASAAGVKFHLPRDIPTRQAFAQLVRKPLEAIEFDGQILVLVDDLSGGYRYDSDDNISRLIATVADDPAELPDCLRFVVTSRPETWVLRDLPEPALDLMGDQPTSRDDIREYVRSRLTGHADVQVEAWADRIASVSDGNFLYVRHVLDDIVNDEEALTGSPAALALPQGLTALYGRWFKTSLARHRDVWWDFYLPVLSALTVARGIGLTRAQLSGITGLTEMKVRRAIEECQQYLLGTLPDGPFRIYHDSFREFLAAEEVSVDDAHRDVVNYFVRRFDDDWLGAEAYAQEHLAAHAAAVQALPDLVSRPAFLIAAEPTALLHELSQQADSGDGHLLEAYRRAGWLFASRDQGERAAYLELAVREIGDNTLAAEIGGLTLHRPWRAQWAHLLRHRPSRVVGAHPGGVLALTEVGLEDRTILASGGNDGAVRLWDPTTRMQLGEPVKLATYGAIHLTSVVVGGDLLLAAAGTEAIWLIDPLTGRVMHTMTTRPNIRVTALTTAAVDELEVLVVGYADGILEALDPGKHDRVGDPIQAHDGPVTSLGTTFGNLVMSGGVDGKAVVWDWAEPDSAGASVASVGASEGWIGACDLLMTTEDSWVMAAGDSDGVLHLVDGSGDEVREVTQQMHAPIGWQYGVHAINDSGSSVSQSENSGLRTYQEVLAQHERQEQEREREESERQESYDPGAGPRQAPAASPMDIVGVWGGVNALTVAGVGDRAVMVSGGQDGRVIVVDLSVEQLTAEDLVVVGEPVSAVLLANVGGRPSVVAADSAQGGTIREWPLSADGALPALVGDQDAYATRFDVAHTEDGRCLMAVATSAGTVTLVDADSGESVAPSLDVSDLYLSGLRLLRFAERDTLVAFGLAREEGGGLLRMWMLGSAGVDTAVDVRLDGSADVRDVAVVGDAPPRLLVACSGEGAGEDENEDEDEDAEGGNGLYQLVRNADGWVISPLGPTSSEQDDGWGYQADPTWVARLPGDEPLVLIAGEMGDTWVLNLEDMSITQPSLSFWELAAPTVLRGRPAILHWNSSSLRLACLDLVDDLDEDEDGIVFEGLEYGSVRALAATDDASLVVAGAAGGSLIVWRGGGLPAQVISVGSTVRQVAIVGNDTVFARTDMGLLSLRVE